MGILTTIRQRPENQKKIFSFVVAIILTFFIVGIWFSFSDSPNKKLAGEKKDTLSSISPIQMMKDEFSKAFSNISSEDSDLESSENTVQVEIIEEDLLVSTSSATTSATSTENDTNI